jgi:RNA polymerase sigma-70 factor, ECF subfamily
MDSGSWSQMQNQSVYLGLEDDQLVALAQTEDPEAFSTLIARHRQAALKVALSILRDKQDAEDEVQNSFWKAYRHISQFQRDAKFSTWLTRIVVNQCLMRLRQLKRARFAFIDDSQPGDEISVAELRDRRQSPEQELGRFEVSSVLWNEIRRTPPLLRDVFLLRDVQEKPMPEVAEILGISVAAAKSRLLRARAEIRNRLQKHCGALGPATLMTNSYYG